MYLVNELQQRIEVISKKTGGGYSDFRSRIGTNSSVSSSINAFKGRKLLHKYSIVSNDCFETILILEFLVQKLDKYYIPT